MLREPLTMKSLCKLWMLALCPMAISAQQPPQATKLPGDVFVIKNTWFIGGAGPWDYLTMDAASRRLYIAHGPRVQVVDVETGTLAGEITGIRQAHAIALDESGEFGYISDGMANEVKVFDRRSLQVVAAIATGPTPRALVLDAQTGLLFAICTNPLTEQPPPAAQRQGSGGVNPSAAARSPTPQPGANREIKTSISVIDVTARRRIGEILMPGRLGFAQSDGNGQIFVLIVDRNQVARLDASAIAALLHQDGDAAATPNVEPASAEAVPAQANASQAGPAKANPAGEQAAPTMLDWSHESQQPQSAQDSMRLFALGPACHEPRALAVDGRHQRLFAACDNMYLAVFNAGSGELVTSLSIGPGADTVGYDPGRGLIYTANGDAQGTLTIVRQDVTDTYATIQNLPTRQRARTLALNPDTGEVYLVTDYVGVNLAQPGSIGGLKMRPVEGSFQVLVIGH
jgi:DNA-binding beta-propeller fold protein YncE